MAEKELSILVRAKGALQAAQQIGKVDSAIGRLGRLGGKAISNLTANLTRAGLAVGVGIAGAVGMGIRSLTDLSRTTLQTSAVIQSTGGKAGVTAGQVRKYAEELEQLTTVDDKVIQDGENMLLTFTGISSKAFPRATKATLNLAVAMAKGDASQVDMKASAIQVGKALNDPIKGVTALRKVGVSFTEQQQKQIKALVKAGKTYEAQTIILKELETEFGKAGEAAGKGPAATWRRLQDVGEDLSMALARGLLPVLERAGKWLSTKLSDPAVIAAIEDIGEGLGDAAGEMLNFIETVDFKAIGEGLHIAAGAAGSIVSAFMAMPDWVKIAVVSGWGLNKLTGGALGGIVGELGKGLIKGVLGMNAGVVNINAGVVNGAGGVPGVAAKGGGALASAAGGVAAAGGWGAVGAAMAVGFVPVAAAGLTLAITNTPEMRARAQAGLNATAAARTGRPDATARGPRGTINVAEEWFANRANNLTGNLGRTGPAVRLNPQVENELSALGRFARSSAPSQESMKRHLANIEGLQRGTASNDALNASRIVAAINSLKSIIGKPPTINVYSSAADNAAADARRHRTVKPNGPRNSYAGWRADG